jgi:hypothetical protein
MLVPDVSASRKMMKPKNIKLSIEDKVEGRAAQEEEEGGIHINMYMLKYIYIVCMYTNIFQHIKRFVFIDERLYINVYELY